MHMYTGDDSQLVKEMFAALASDWTPSSVGGDMRMLYVQYSREPQVAVRCARVLSDAERAIADRFLDGDDCDRFLQRRAFRRYCGAVALGESQTSLSEMVFAETDKGRPYLPDNPDLWFSFSSCSFGFLGAWSDTDAIGVDIEDQTKGLEAYELAKHFFSEAEAEIVDHATERERGPTFIRLWSLKESALKSVGEGLPLGLDAFQFEFDPDPRVSHAPAEHGGPEHFAAHLVEGVNVCAAVVSRRRLRV
jgi:phosphopantetheinyl transferase